jgi:hypothetical protein
MTDQGSMNIEVYTQRTVGEDKLVRELESPLELHTLMDHSESEHQL